MHYLVNLFGHVIGYGNFFCQQIDREREGEQIDRALLKNVLDIFVEIGLGSMECYENDFEDFLLKDTADYYSIKAQTWILEDSCPDYMLKVSSSEETFANISICGEHFLMEIFFIRLKNA